MCVVEAHLFNSGVCSTAAGISNTTNVVICEACIAVWESHYKGNPNIMEQLPTSACIVGLDKGLHSVSVFFNAFYCCTYMLNVSDDLYRHITNFKFLLL